MKPYAKPLVLGSESPFRKMLLEQVGLDFITAAPRMDEEEVKKASTMDPADLPLELAKKKAASLIPEYSDHIIIGSDQMATFNGKAISKPKSKTEAFEQLKTLAGHTHYLRTALAVWDEGEWYTNTTLATMSMRPLTDEEIQNYIEKDIPVGCAGGTKLKSLVRFFSTRSRQKTTTRLSASPCFHCVRF